MQKLDIIKAEISRLLKTNNDVPWERTKLIFEFPPYINKGHTGSQFFWDSEGNKLRKVLFLDEMALKFFYSFIFQNNQANEYNTIIFETKKDDYENASIILSFNKEVEETFQNNLPKSKRGKTIPWWKNSEETKDLDK